MEPMSPPSSPDDEPTNSDTRSGGARIREVRRIARFLLVGVFNTAFGYAMFALAWWLWEDRMIAVVFSNVAGMVWNYFTIGRFVFANKGLGAMPVFFIGYGLVLGANLVIMAVLAQFNVPALTAQLICMPVMICISYVYNALVTFRRQRA